MIAPFISKNGDNFYRRYYEKIDKVDTATNEMF